MDEIALEILQYSYWEHYKMSQDLSLYLNLKHPKRVSLEAELNIIREKMKNIELKIKDNE